jgi:hypothetical protein
VPNWCVTGGIRVAYKTPAMKLGQVLSCVVVSIALGAMAHAQAQVSDRNVKAAFLVRFADFVTWPDESPARPFTVCLSPSHTFGDAVAATARGTMVRGRPMVVRHLRARESVATCQLLYVAPADEHLLPLSRRHPILTVGEGQEFCQRGGVINLRVVDDRVRFEVSLTQAKASGLSIDSQLLRLALAVHGGRQ